MFIREKKISCGEYMEVDVIPRTEKAELACRGKRGKKRRVSTEKQTDLNDKNSRRYLVQLGNGNFGKGDIHVSCTYDNEHLPGTVEEAERIVSNYLRRIAYRKKKLGLPPLKYILVTEYKHDKDGGWLVRVHHHIIMNGGLDRDEVEAMWTKQRINWNRFRNDKDYTVKTMGYVNADRLRPDKNGIEALCKYITKRQKGRKRWSSSRNLKRPHTERADSNDAKYIAWRNSRNLKDVTEKCNDFKYSKRKVERLAKSTDYGLSEFEKIYSGYNIAEVKAEYYEKTGWHIYLKMWKKQKGKGCGRNADEHKRRRKRDDVPGRTNKKIARK